MGERRTHATAIRSAVCFERVETDRRNETGLSYFESIFEISFVKGKVLFKVFLRYQTDSKPSDLGQRVFILE